MHTGGTTYLTNFVGKAIFHCAIAIWKRLEESWSNAR